MPEDHYRILMVEGSLMGGYEIGLETAIELVKLLADAHSHNLIKPVELLVVGRVSEDVKRRYASYGDISVEWIGLVPPDQIPDLDRSAHLLYSADINAACPNAVIEALACGTPVLAYDTGAIPELVSEDSGRVIPYGGDPWKLDTPDLQGLAAGAVGILNKQERYRSGARRRAEAVFGLEKMVEGYLTALNPV
jgi:glycosyltransferase involved in cell wall biosynthesis